MHVWSFVNRKSWLKRYHCCEHASLHWATITRRTKLMIRTRSWLKWVSRKQKEPLETVTTPKQPWKRTPLNTSWTGQRACSACVKWEEWCGEKPLTPSHLSGIEHEWALRVVWQPTSWQNPEWNSSKSSTNVLIVVNQQIVMISTNSSSGFNSPTELYVNFWKTKGTCLF